MSPWMLLSFLRRPSLDFKSNYENSRFSGVSRIFSFILNYLKNLHNVEFLWYLLITEILFLIETTGNISLHSFPPKINFYYQTEHRFWSNLIKVCLLIPKLRERHCAFVLNEDFCCIQVYTLQYVVPNAARIIFQN